MHRSIFASAIKEQPKTANSSQGEGGSVTRVTRDSLLKQTERLRDARRREEHRMCTQINVVGGQIVG
jgi:hypothetical protein